MDAKNYIFVDRLNDGVVIEIDRLLQLLDGGFGTQTPLLEESFILLDEVVLLKFTFFQKDDRLASTLYQDIFFQAGFQLLNCLFVGLLQAHHIIFAPSDTLDQFLYFLSLIKK